VLFRLVRANEGNTRIVVTGERMSRSAYAAHRSYSARRQRPARRYRAQVRRYRDDDSFGDIFSDDPPAGRVVYGGDVPDQDYAVRRWWNR